MNLLAGPFLSMVWRTAPLRSGAILCASLAILASAAEVAVAFLLLPILSSLGIGAGTDIESIIGRVDPRLWLALFAIVAGVRSGLTWLSSIHDQRNSEELTVGLQSRLYRALAGAHWDTVRRISPPTITSALHTQTYDAAWGFSSMIQVTSATFLIIGYITSAAFVFPLLLPVLLVLLALMWAVNAHRNRKVLAHSENYVGAQTDLHQQYEDWVAINRISSLGVDTGSLADRFESGAREAAAYSVGFSRSAVATNISYQAAVVAAILIGVPIAWWLESPPALLAFGLVLVVRVLPRAGSIQTGYQGVVNAVAPLRAIDDLASRLEQDTATSPVVQNRLEWRQISLADVGLKDADREAGHRWILRNISLNLKHGEWLALTGPTGAGKTTLAEIMLMLVRPDKGEIRVDSSAADEELAGRWRDQAAYVPQDVVLFDAPIRDNLRLYVPDASDDELKAALRQSAGEFVMERLPDSLDTRAGPGGRWLSGGERQRIGIARALLRKPGFLVLDEPTAALDAHTQAKLMDALGDLDHKMSVILITHRPELLKLADRVIEIMDGQIKR